ncbi:MAG: PEP-CTERM sorting domain-containing protein [Myxococcota bacterium]
MLRSLSLLALTLGLVLAGSASALTIDVSGAVGDGTSEWTFSGTSSAGSLPASAQVDGFFSLGSPNFFTNLNTFQGAVFTSGAFGFGAGVSTLGPGPSVTGSTSGSHVLQGFQIGDVGTSIPRYAWFADGAFPGNETLTFAGTATANFEIGLIAGISGFGDTATVTASSGLGDLTINFTAVPEPATSGLLALGLGGLAWLRSRHGRA